MTTRDDTLPLLNEKFWVTADSDQILASVQSTSLGISEEDAKQRLAKFGPNQLREKRKASPLLLFLGQFKNFLTLVLIIASVISFGIGEIVEAIAIFLIVILAGVLGFIQEYQASKAIESLRKMASSNATVLREGRQSIIPSQELVPGDVILLKAGDKIPADSRVLEVVNFKVDEAPLTGESIPVEKVAQPLPSGDVSIGDRKNMLHMGTLVTYGKGRAVVLATGMLTEFGKIADMLRTTEHPPTPLQVNLARLGKWLGLFAIVLATAMSLLGVLRGYEAVEMFVWGVALVVAVIPEALPAVVTITLAIGVRRMVKRNALIRKLPAVETLGATTIICSDKTGTLTQNEMTVRMISVNGRIINVDGVGYSPIGRFWVEGVEIHPPADQHLQELLTAAVLCNDASLLYEEDQWHVTGDPTEGALIVAAAKAGIEHDASVRSFPRLREIPFSSERKSMTTLHPFPDGIRALSKGAPEIILASCTHLLRDGTIFPLDEARRFEILEAALQMTRNALRVLAFSTRSLTSQNGADEDIEQNMVFLGLAGLMDPPRPEAKRAIQTCQEAGIRPVMITGDHKVTAEAVAQELGFLNRKEIFSGLELDQLSESELEGVVDRVDVFARISPAHKLRIVSAFQKKGHIVAMTGDGVNDAPALKRADIGVAMGITGTDVSKEASDMILTNDNFASIVAAVEEGRGIFENIRKYLVFLLSGNMGTVFGMIVALMFSLPLPLTAVQILFINFLMDGLIAIALGLEPPEAGIMKKLPRRKGEGILNRPAQAYIFIVGALIAAVSFSVYFWSLEVGYSTDEAMTMFFITLIVSRLLNGLNCRSFDASVFQLGPFTNIPLLVGTVLVLLLTSLTLYIGILQKAFQTTSLDSQQWGMAFAASLVVLFAVEIWKIVRRRKRRAERK